MIPQVLTNLNLYVDGRGFAGRVTEIQLPKLKRKTDGYRAGGMDAEVDMGSWKPGDKGETKYTASLSYYKLEIDGRAIYEIDPVNCVRIINGTDELAAKRAAIGL
ncbi:phage major tail tube protein [Laribacter hongkongensis]|uniref:Phage tail protein n=2 Tax=Laribacter hongkongensis TaxID=168471 RepID=A0A248LI16_9NEIS|nr:phage major tail tube protein [Laribacter hongkongensis]ASJ24398.1 phage tail protein [Laribacter hongkongensis]MCG9040227.1 phage major tail tube protein [Laribacter hongkongensis]MCG9068373.1 phage major tail tube protein [Laribacter hongkongensis]MCG9089790.1 phage major tail tube protein [Laribacter hongkongensis]MCG9108619.1 phage major tail tube protein [Laribacter hongkongensis]